VVVKMGANNNNKPVSFEFAVNEMRTNKANIQAWAQQSDNPFLKSLACEVIAVAGARMRAQGEEIRQWALSENPLLAQTCKEIIEAAGATQ